MCLICLLIHFQVHNCTLSTYNSMVFFHYNRYCKLDSSVRLTRILPKCSAHIRYVYVLGNVLVTYSLIQIPLAHISSTVPWGEDTDSVEVNCIVSLAMLCSFSCKSSFLAFKLGFLHLSIEQSLVMQDVGFADNVLRGGDLLWLLCTFSYTLVWSGVCNLTRYGWEREVGLWFFIAPDQPCLP